MKFKTYTGITWSQLELTGLFEDEDSRVSFEKFKKHIGLHPFHLTNLHAALNEILSSNLNSYDANLKGFLLAYKNPKLLTPLGETFYDTCFIHVDIEADFYVFRPEVGCSLKGIVNKKGLDHIGILVHKAFNVSISKPEDVDDWTGDCVDIGQEVRFVVTYLDFTSKLPFIRGTLDPDDYTRGCRIINNVNDREKSRESSDSAVPEINNQKHRQKRKSSFFNADSEDSSNASDNGEARIKKLNVQKIISKKSLKKDPEMSDDESVIDREESIKKTKKKSKAKIVEIQSVQHQLLNNSRKSADFSSTDNETPTKLKKFKESIIKSLATTSDSENTAEEDVSYSKVKKEKKSIKKKYSDIGNHSTNVIKDESVNGPVKKRSQKLRTSDVPNDDALVTVKTEKSKGRLTDNQEIGDAADVSSPKKQRKRHKSCSLQLDSDYSETSESPKKNSPKNRSRKSSDSEFSTKLIKIKKEKTGPNCPEEQGKHEHNETSSSESTKSPKKMKKRAKWSSEEVVTESAFEDVKIKEEKLDDSFDLAFSKNENASKDTTELKSQKKKRRLKSDASIYEEISFERAFESPKKMKLTDKESKVHAVKVKMEKIYDSADEKATKKLIIANHGSINNMESDSSQEEKKHCKDSPRKHTKSKKSEVEFDFSEVRVKVENSVDS